MKTWVIYGQKGMELAEKLIEDHKNPLVKFTFSGTKLFLKSDDVADVKLVEDHLNVLQKVLTHNRVERRCARAQCIWLPEQTLAKITKVVKHILNMFGFQDKNGIYLYPEEMLFLLETNRLELHLNNLNASIQDGYDILTNSPEYSLNRYRVFKKLASQGYRILNKKEYDKRKTKAEQKAHFESLKKQKEDLEISHIDKKIKMDSKIENVTNVIEMETIDSKNDDQEQSCASKKHENKLQFVNHIIENIRSKGPVEYIDDRMCEPDYYIYLPSNNSLCYDHKLYICEDNRFNTMGSREACAVYAVCSGDNISFYQFASVLIPTIHY